MKKQRDMCNGYDKRTSLTYYLTVCMHNTMAALSPDRLT